jgi:hypothetical protein
MKYTIENLAQRIQDSIEIEEPTKAFVRDNFIFDDCLANVAYNIEGYQNSAGESVLTNLEVLKVTIYGNAISLTDAKLTELENLIWW